MKPYFTFHFIDEPQFRTGESREHVAHLLRAFRKQSKQYALARVANGYTVQVRGSSAIGLIEKHRKVQP